MTDYPIPMEINETTPKPGPDRPNNDGANPLRPTGGHTDNEGSGPPHLDTDTEMLQPEPESQTVNSVRVLHPGPGGHQGIESQHQLGGHPTPGMTQRIPFSLGPPQLEYGTPGMTEVPSGRPPSRVPVPYNVAGSFRGNPTVVYSGVPVTGDLKSLASRYLHNPASNVDKLRIRRSRSGAVKVSIFLDIPIASVVLRLDQFAPAILEASHDGPSGHGVPPLNIAGPSRANPSMGHPANPGMSVTEDMEDLAGRYLHNPRSHVDKLRMKQSQSGCVKILIVLEIEDSDTM